MLTLLLPLMAAIPSPTASPDTEPCRYAATATAVTRDAGRGRQVELVQSAVFAAQRHLTLDIRPMPQRPRGTRLHPEATALMQSVQGQVADVQLRTAEVRVCRRDGSTGRQALVATYRFVHVPGAGWRTAAHARGATQP